MKVIERIQVHVREWNKAAEPWVAALNSDGERFLRLHDGAMKKLGRAAMGIRLGATQISNPKLRARLRAVGDAYVAQFRAGQDVGQAYAGNSQAAADAAVRKLQRLNRMKQKHAFRLADDFPQLGTAF